MEGCGIHDILTPALEDHLDNAEPEKGKNQETYVDFARWLAEEKSLNTTFFGIGSDIRTEAIPMKAMVSTISR